MPRIAHLIIEHPVTQKKFLRMRALVRKSCRAALMRVGVADAEFSVLLTDDAAIQTLNHDFRGKNKATNVLAFPSPEEGQLGDIAVSMDTVEREAMEQGKRVEDHLTHLLVHAVLHLLGHDHERAGEAARMEGLEISILQSLGIKNPYL